MSAAPAINLVTFDLSQQHPTIKLLGVVKVVDRRDVPKSWMNEILGIEWLALTVTGLTHA